MKMRHFYPLLGFVIPTLLIGYGFVIPRTSIAGVNELTVGFATTVIGACARYIFGVRAVANDLSPSTCEQTSQRFSGESH